MIKVIGFYQDEEILKELNSFIQEKKIVIDNEHIFIKEENLPDIFTIINQPEYKDYFDSNIYSLKDHISWFDDGDYIKTYDGREIYKWRCIDKLLKKIDKDKSIVNKIFELKDNQVFNYLEKQIDLQFIDIIEDEIKELRKIQNDINNGKKIEWQ